MINDKPPDPSAVIFWTIVTWAGAVIGVVASAFDHDWIAALFAVNAAVIAAGWVLACHRWAHWQALALSALKELEIRTRDGHEHDGTP